MTRQGGVRYVWDARKARTNLRKHGLSFEVATEAFEDDRGLLLPDEAHSDAEERTILIGRIGGGVVVTVVYSQDADGVRIISARQATAHERRRYDGDEEG
jgi:hypothetical protein